MERREGTGGGQLGGGEDAEMIDLVGGCETDTPGQRRKADTRGPNFPAARCHQLGIIDLVKGAEDGGIGWKNESGCTDRSSPGAAAGFVDASDLRVASIPKRQFEIKGWE